MLFAVLFPTISGRTEIEHSPSLSGINEKSPPPEGRGLKVPVKAVNQNRFENPIREGINYLRELSRDFFVTLCSSSTPRNPP